ncbi:MAG: glyoxylate/hydroxypyruvate reductase A [Pseudomonadota bacterium]
MTLLLDIRQPEWLREEDLHNTLAPHLPGVELLCGIQEKRDDVVMAAVVDLYPDVIGLAPNLQLVQKLGAGVDGILHGTGLPEHIRVTRLVTDLPAMEIAEYCLAHVLQFQRNLHTHRSDQSTSHWNPLPPRLTSETTVCVLGLGVIGGLTASKFANLGYQVVGWSKSAKSLDGVDCRHGESMLGDVLEIADYLVCILPSTPETRDFINHERLTQMKPNAVLINAGRGDLVVDGDLTSALDNGAITHAVLDVFRQEPLPPEHPFWSHSGITVTPHVSGWHQGDALLDVAANYKRLIAGEPLLHEVDRRAGY